MKSLILRNCMHLLLVVVVIKISETEANENLNKEVKVLLEKLDFLKMKQVETLKLVKEIEVSFPRPFHMVSNFVRNDARIVQMKVFRF